jgi:hypothetical protein
LSRLPQRLVTSREDLVLPYKVRDLPALDLEFDPGAIALRVAGQSVFPEGPDLEGPIVGGTARGMLGFRNRLADRVK